METLITVKDIQARLGIGRSSVYSLIHEPGFPTPYVINSKVIRWSLADFNTWLEERKVMPKIQIKKEYIRQSNTVVVNGVRFRKGKK